MIIRALLAAAVLLPSIALAEFSPYAGQQSRAIKALSQEDIDGLLQGKGMELAKPAELNSYPGPRHALDLAIQLGLSPEQIEALERVQARMSAEAKALGVEIVKEEEVLDRMFAERKAVAAMVDASTQTIGELHGRLRAVHLRAHLDTMLVMTANQVHRYDVLRGYTQTGPAEVHQPGSGAAGHGDH